MCAFVTVTPDNCSMDDIEYFLGLNRVIKSYLEIIRYVDDEGNICIDNERDYLYFVDRYEMLFNIYLCSNEAELDNLDNMFDNLMSVYGNSPMWISCRITSDEYTEYLDNNYDWL